MSFNCILWWVVELDGCRGVFFLEDYIVIYENEINIVVIGSTRISVLKSGKMVLFIIWSMSVLA